MRRALCMLFLASALGAQVTGRFSPGPLDQFGAVGLWYCSVCNDYPVQVTLAPERIVMVSGPIPLLRPTEAAQLMGVKRAQSKKFVASEIIEYGLIGAGVIGGSGLFSITPKILASLAAGTGVAHQLQDKWRSQIPAMPTFDGDLFSGPISLAPGACVTKQVYTRKMAAKSVVPLAFTIQVPSAQTGPQITPRFTLPQKQDTSDRESAVVASLSGEADFEVHLVRAGFWRGVRW